MKIKLNPKARIFYSFVFILTYLVVIHTLYKYTENESENLQSLEKRFIQNKQIIIELLNQNIPKDNIVKIFLKNKNLDILVFHSGNKRLETKEGYEYRDIKLDANNGFIMGVDTKYLDDALFDKFFQDLLIGCMFLFFVYPFLVAIRREIREENRVKLEHEKVLSRQHRLAQMGALLNNIAHQFRQPLAQINAIMASLETAFYKNKLDEKQLDDKITKVEDVTEYLSSTIEDFRNYFKQNKQKEKFLISSAVDNALNIISTNIEKNSISIEKNIIQDKELYLPKGEYIQVLISIVLNSIDQAIKNKIETPKITFTIDNSLSIGDNAGGINEKNIEKVFELDFTTKGEKGTGLGLYMSKMLVENSFHGSIEVKNHEDGVVFKIEC